MTDTTTIRDFLNAHKSRWLSWGSKGVLALIDQGLIGGANFLMAILLGRQLARAEYGAYALAFEIFMVLSLVYSCLILEPMLVFGPSTYRDNFRRYFGVLLWMHLAVGLVTSVLLGAAAWVIYEAGKSSDLPPVLIAAMAATPCVLMFWLARRAFYVNLEPKKAVLGGLIYGLVLLGGVLLLYRFRALSPARAFLIMAAGSLAASPFLIAQLKPLISWKPVNPTLREASTKHWIYGRWALSGAVASWISGNIYYLLLSSIRGLADTGSLKALLNLSSPVGQVFAALFVLSFPYAARLYQQDGSSGVLAFSFRLTPLYSLAAVGYWIVFILFHNPILHLLYGSNYQHIGGLIPYVALGSIFRIAATVQVMSLKAAQAPFLSFVAWTIADIVAVFVGIPSIWVLGLQGALLAYVLSGAAILIGSFLLLRIMARRGAGDRIQAISEIPGSSGSSALKSSIPVA